MSAADVSAQVRAWALAEAGRQSFDGTRTSRRWENMPGNYDTVNARAVYPSSNEYGIPDLPVATLQAARRGLHGHGRGNPATCRALLRQVAAAAAPGRARDRVPRQVELMGGRGSSGSNGGAQKWSLAKVGKLASGNEEGMTVAEEYHQKEILGNYSENDYIRAKDAGFASPKDYQKSITDHIAKHGIINAAQASYGALDEGYHRYAAMRKLKQRSMPVREYLCLSGSASAKAARPATPGQAATARCSTPTPPAHSNARHARTSPRSSAKPPTTPRPRPARQHAGTTASGGASPRKSSPQRKPANGAAASSPRPTRPPATTSSRRHAAARTTGTTSSPPTGPATAGAAGRCDGDNEIYRQLAIYTMSYIDVFNTGGPRTHSPSRFFFRGTTRRYFLV